MLLVSYVTCQLCFLSLVSCFFASSVGDDTQPSPRQVCFGVSRREVKRRRVGNEMVGSVGLQETNNFFF